MKKEVQIKRQRNDTYLKEIVLMHREIYKETELNGKLIYFDIAFNDYFKSVLNSDENYIFGVFFQNKIHGFIHLRKIDSVLFLNNIFLSEFIRGKGTGTYVLNKILMMPFVSENNFVQLKLDVLESNSFVRKWYERIGLTQESTESWYYVKKNIPQINPDLKLAYDKNCFKSVFLHDLKVATVIEKTCIILHDFRALDFRINLPFIVKTNESFKNTNIQFLKFDSSIRMLGEIVTILKNTNNAKI